MTMRSPDHIRYQHSFRNVVPIQRAGCPRVTHPFATRLRRAPFDLHVLGMPPAFVLSQDQTLQNIWMSLSAHFIFKRKSFDFVDSSSCDAEPAHSLFLGYCSVFKVLSAVPLSRRLCLFYPFALFLSSTFFVFFFRHTSLQLNAFRTASVSLSRFSALHQSDSPILLVLFPFVKCFFYFFEKAAKQRQPPLCSIFLLPIQLSTLNVFTGTGINA